MSSGYEARPGTGRGGGASQPPRARGAARQPGWAAGGAARPPSSDLSGGPLVTPSRPVPCGGPGGSLPVRLRDLKWREGFSSIQNRIGSGKCFKQKSNVSPRSCLGNLSWHVKDGGGRRGRHWTKTRQVTAALTHTQVGFRGQGVTGTTEGFDLRGDMTFLVTQLRGCRDQPQRRASWERKSGFRGCRVPCL